MLEALKSKIEEAKEALKREGAAFTNYRADSEAEYKARQVLCVEQEKAHQKTAALYEMVADMRNAIKAVEDRGVALDLRENDVETRERAVEVREAALAEKAPTPNAAPVQPEPAATPVE